MTTTTDRNSAVRVPLLVKRPAVAGGVCEAPVEWFDVGPTLAEFAGAEIDFAQFAVSLTPSLRDPGVATSSEALSETRPRCGSSGHPGAARPSSPPATATRGPGYRSGVRTITAATAPRRYSRL